MERLTLRGCGRRPCRQSASTTGIEGTAMTRYARTSADQQGKSLHSVLTAPTMQDPVADPAVSSLEDDIAAIEDWDDLFRVIRKRLGETDDETLSMSSGVAGEGAQSRVSPALLKCVAQLHLLHLTVMGDLRRHDQLEREVVDAHGTLARLRGDIIGSR